VETLRGSGREAREIEGQQDVSPCMLERDVSPLVFIVDDDPDDDPSVFRAIYLFLRRAGFRTSSTGDAAGAHKGIRAKQPDLILLDVNPRDRSGFALTSLAGDDDAAESKGRLK
jgi:CheY-like chemotaxis protein